MTVKVLAVDDEQWIHNKWLPELEGKVELLSAGTIEDARKMFAEHPDIAAIAMDACVPGDEPNTMELVREFRKTFSGPMLAASGLGDYRELLMKAGCDYDVGMDKNDVPGMFIKILGL